MTASYIGLSGLKEKYNVAMQKLFNRWGYIYTVSYFVTEDSINFLCSENSKPNCSGITFDLKPTDNINEIKKGIIK